MAVEEPKGTAAEVSVGRDPDAVRRARRFIRSSLDGEPPDLVADAELVVTELVTNASLHGEPPITIRLIQAGTSVRVEVEDAGRKLPMQGVERSDAMTGRGLSVVAATTSSWGVSPGPNGRKTVWAEFPSPPERLRRLRRFGTSGPSPSDLKRMRETWDGADEQTYEVVLPGVPTDLLLAAKAHIDNVVRELTLLRRGEAASGVSLPAEMDNLVRTVTVEFADVRSELKREAAAAVERGEAMTDLTLQLPLSAAEAAGRYLAALEQVDRYARAAHLLTLAPPRSHRIFRQWYLNSIVDQLSAAEQAADPVPMPRPFALALAREVDRLPRLEDASVRLSVLQRICSRLPECRSDEEMATAVVDNLARLPGVDAAVVHLLTADGLLEPVAWKNMEPSAGPIPIDADQPEAVVCRSGRPLYVRSLKQIYDEFPDMADRFTGERSLHMVPMTIGERNLGVLSLTFLGGAMADDTQAGFITAIAEVLAQAIHRTAP